MWAFHQFGAAGPGRGDPIIVASLAAMDEPAPNGRSLEKLESPRLQLLPQIL